MALQGRWIVGLAVVLMGVPTLAWGQTAARAATAEVSRDVEAGYAGWFVEHDVRHQVMAGLVFRRQSPLALVVRATGASASTDDHETSAVGSYSREGRESLFTVSGGARLEGRLPKATVSLQALLGVGVTKSCSTITIDDAHGRRESAGQSSSIGFLSEISAGLHVPVTRRVDVFGTVGVTGPPQNLVSFRMPTVTAGVSITLPAPRSAQRR